MPPRKILMLPDTVRGRQDKKVKVRFDPGKVIFLKCGHRYGDNGLTVPVIKDMEFYLGFGKWSPYPSVTLFGDLKKTRVLIRRADGRGFHTMESRPGRPDEMLWESAKKAGVHTAIVDCNI